MRIKNHEFSSMFLKSIANLLNNSSLVFFSIDNLQGIKNLNTCVFKIDKNNQIIIYNTYMYES